MFRDHEIATGRDGARAALAPAPVEGEAARPSRSRDLATQAATPESSPHGPSGAGKAVERRAVIALPARECHVRTARRFASALLGSWHVVEEDRVSALLIVSELAGNAAQHGRSEMAVHLWLDGCALRIDVADSGKPSPSPRVGSGDGDGDAEDERGRGLAIVESLADRTETYHDQGGRRVRAVLGICTRTSRAA